MTPPDHPQRAVTRRAARGAARKGSPIPDAICGVAEQLLAEERPERLTVSAILRRSGTRRTSFYHWFASKHDVLAELLERVADELDDALVGQVELRPDPAPALSAALGAAFDVWERHRALLGAAQADAGSRLGICWNEVVERRWVAPLAQRLRDEPPAATVDPLALARSLCGMTAEALRAHVDAPPDAQARAAALDALTHVWARSLAPAPAGRRRR